MAQEAHQIGEYYENKYKEAAAIRAQIKETYKTRNELVKIKAKAWKITACNELIEELEEKLQQTIHVGD